MQALGRVRPRPALPLLWADPSVLTRSSTARVGASRPHWGSAERGTFRNEFCWRSLAPLCPSPSWLEEKEQLMKPSPPCIAVILHTIFRLQSCCLLSCVKPGLGGCSCHAVSPILSECPHLSHIHSWKSVLFVGFLAVLLSWGLCVWDSPQMASDVMLDSFLVFWRK